MSCCSCSSGKADVAGNFGMDLGPDFIKQIEELKQLEKLKALQNLEHYQGLKDGYKKSKEKKTRSKERNFSISFLTPSSAPEVASFPFGQTDEACPSCAPNPFDSDPAAMPAFPQPASAPGVGVASFSGFPTPAAAPSPMEEILELMEDMHREMSAVRTSLTELRQEVRELK